MKPPLPMPPAAAKLAVPGHGFCGQPFLPPALTFPTERGYAALLVVLLHGALLFALLNNGPARPTQGPRPPAVLEISLQSSPAPQATPPTAHPPAPTPAPMAPTPPARRHAPPPPLAAAPHLPSTEAPLGPNAPQAAPANTSASPQPGTTASPPDEGRPAKGAGGPVTGPRFDADYLDNPKPAYPPLSRRMGEEGKAVLRVFVDASGRPGKLEIQHSSGFPRLDQAALQAVAQWHFVPARQGGEALAAWVLVPLVFRLDQ